jgi:basic membrane protein A
MMRSPDEIHEEISDEVSMAYKGKNMILQKKIRKQLFRIGITVALCLFLAACNTAGETVLETESTTEESSTVMETETEPETEPVPITREISELRIGMIFYGTEEETSLLSLSLREGLTQAALEAGMEEDQLLWTYVDREASWTEIEDSILSFVDSGCQLIFGGAREYASVIAAIAEEYPDIMFACVGSDLGNQSNSGNYTIDLAAAQYLCGVAAALSDTTGHIGFLAAKDQSNQVMTQAVNAFAYGVWSVNPDAVVELGITGKWYLPEAEIQGIQDFSEKNCDVVGGWTDSYSGLSEALNRGWIVTAYGTDSWIPEEYTEQIAGVAAYRWNFYFACMIEHAINKEVGGEFWTGDYSSKEAAFSTAGQWDLSSYYEWLSTQLPEDSPEEGTEQETEGQETVTQETVTQEAESLEAATQETEIQETETQETETQETESQETEILETESPEEEEELPVIEMDEDTGYLKNVRVHEIVLPKSE